MASNPIHLICHCPDLQGEMAASIAQKHLIEQGVELAAIEVCTPSNIPTLSEVSLWVLGCGIPQRQMLAMFEIMEPLADVDGRLLHVIDASPETAQYYDPDKRPWFHHAEQFAKKCPECYAKGIVAANCHVCNGTGYTTPAPGLAETTWRVLFDHSRVCSICNGSGHFERLPVPESVRYVDDVEHKLPDSKAIRLALSTSHTSIMGMYLSAPWPDVFKELVLERGRTMLDYQSHLARQFGPMLLRIMRVMPLDPELPALIAELGIEAKGESE